MVLEPVQGEGGFIPMPPDFSARSRRSASEHGIVYVDDEVQAGCGRTGPVWAIEHYGVEPDLLVSGKSLGGGLPLAAVTGRAEIMDARARRAASAARSAATRWRAPRRTPCSTSSSTPTSASAPSSSATLLRTRLDEMAARASRSRRGARARPDARARARPSRHGAGAEGGRRPPRRERGLMLLSCGLYGNVMRLLAAALCVRRGARPRARDHGGGAWRRRLRLSRGERSRRRPAVRLERHPPNVRRRRRGRRASTSRSPRASSSRCSGRRARARRRRCG